MTKTNNSAVILPLTHHCKVLVILADLDYAVDVYFIREQLKGDLTNQQIASALCWLVKMNKVIKEGPSVGNQSQRSTYRFNDNYQQERKDMCDLGVEPMRQISKRRMTGRAGRPSIINHERNVKTALPNIRYRERKVALLTRLMKKVSSTDKDLFLGIINDYKL
tara:strand:+ start:1048 stop:1539 length:492 start_codon:yes stop_codon:yes gene_type:complete